MALRYHATVPIIDDDALVLDQFPFRDRDLVVSVLCRLQGVQRGVLRAARGGRAPAAAAAQVMSKVRVSLFQKPTAELATFRSIELVTSSFPLSKSLTKAAAGAVVAELLTTFCPPAEPMERAFRLGCAALDALLEGTDPQIAVAYTQFWMLTLSGLLPPVDSLRDTVGRRDLEVLAEFRRMPLKQLASPPPATITRWLDQRVREEAERPLRALSFMRDSG